ncbi:MAG: L-aspartate oxidase [Gemmatimonadota bacterium]|nr:MAG: L-aspartate oxidase [Gemmatimonadota bacterium]
MNGIDTGILVIGSGIAGLTFALRVAEHADVVLVTKKASLDSNTNYAQGGIAAVVDSADSFADHVHDTLQAGAGLCHLDRVDTLVQSGPQAVADLVDWGVRFSESGGRLALGREGGHSHARIVHSQDKTGSAIEDALDRAVTNHERIQLLEDHMVLSLQVECLDGLRRCVGAWVLDVKSNALLPVRARATMLAAGGSAAIYCHTTNPAIATGDGVALAYRAGATVANMEFIQFHPTALYPAEEHAFLISEALRGEGAVLRNWNGDAFMGAYDRRKDLAPRDIVARAVHSEMRRSGKDHVWLDATGIAAQHLDARFPAILEGCRAKGVDARQEPIPVVPAAHYVCGGVWTDVDGRTSLPGLFAAGECACTGVHGANRLASNSLLEAVVFAERAASRMIWELPFVPAPSSDSWTHPDDLSGSLADGLARLRSDLRQLMWERLGIIRTVAEMRAGAVRLHEMRRDWSSLCGAAPRSKDGARWAEASELLNMLDVAGLVIRCALWRRESRGLHYVTDFPYKDNECFLRDSFVIPTD